MLKEKPGSQKPSKKPAKFDFVAFVQRFGSLIITVATAIEKVKPFLPNLKSLGQMFISLLIGYFNHNDF